MVPLVVLVVLATGGSPAGVVATVVATGEGRRRRKGTRGTGNRSTGGGRKKRTPWRRISRRNRGRLRRANYTKLLLECGGFQCHGQVPDQGNSQDAWSGSEWGWGCLILMTLPPGSQVGK